MAHICTASLAYHAEVNFILVSMGDDVTRSRSIYSMDKGVHFSILLLTLVSQKDSRREALNFIFRLPHKLPKRILIHYPIS